MPTQNINQEQIAAFQETFSRDPQARLALNAVTKNPVRAVALNRAVVMNSVSRSEPPNVQLVAWAAGTSTRSSRLPSGA